MGLYMINEAVVMMEKKNHVFTEREKEFAVQFAFKTGDRELTGKLVDELCGCKSKEESERVIQKYAALMDDKPDWIDKAENLIVVLEQYRLEEERAISELVEILRGYGVDISEEKLRIVSADEIRRKVKEKAR